MHLTELRIDDFGCFRNARLTKLEDSLIVIGGPQRAGKTTFMHVLRQFPDGVDRRDELPPATDDYQINAEVRHQGRRYRYDLNGHATPSVSPIGDGPEIEATDLFDPVTERQYRNLYTISLDELRELPPGIDDAEDLARVLLGGAYGDIAEIPELEKAFSDSADDIGLSRGDPTTTTSRLNDPYETIRSGMNARQEASEQVEEYRDVTETLEEKRASLTEIETEIECRKRRRDRLTVLNELFDPLQRLEVLNARLEDVDRETVEAFPNHLADRLDHFENEYETATNKLRKARQTFDREATIDSTSTYAEWLLEHEDAIDSHTDQLSLWEKTFEDLTTQRAGLESTRQELEREIASLHSAWDESFTHLDRIETTAVDTSQVESLASRLNSLRQEREQVKASLDSARTRKAELGSELEELSDDYSDPTEVTLPKRKPAVVAGVAIAIGTLIGVVTNPLIGGVVGLILLGGGLFVMDSTVAVDSNLDVEPYRELKGQVSTLESEISAEKQRLSELDEEIAETETELTDLVRELGLPGELPASEIPSFFDRVLNLKEQTVTYREERAQWKATAGEFASELEEPATLLKQVTDSSWTPEDPLVGAEEVFESLNAVAADLELARAVQRADQERAGWIDDIDSVLTTWDPTRSIDPEMDDESILAHIQDFTAEEERVAELKTLISEREQLETQVSTRLDSPSAQDAFRPLRENEEPWLAVVRNEVDQFADTDAIVHEISDETERIDKLDSRREELRETCIELEQRQEALASESELREARSKIDEGRVEFERLGEAYAVNRIAETMVRELHERLMADIVHSLVDDASEIFSEITRDYDGIALAGDVQELGFRALRSDGPDHEVGELSRATAEQLFLAVRLARIRQTDVSLPVVLDDAATNFDPEHMRRTFAVVDQLVTSNQVFFLTCHPQCVRLIGSTDRAAQYWSLDRGQFTPVESADELAESLSTE